MSAEFMPVETQWHYMRYAANNELRLMTGGILTRGQPRPFTPAEIRQEFLQKWPAGESVSAVDSSRIWERTVNGFARLGAIEQTAAVYNGKESRALVAVPEHASRVLAWCGALMDWRVEYPYPALPLHVVFGKTASGPNTQRARYEIFRHLISHPARMHTTAELTTATRARPADTKEYPSPIDVRNNVRSLVRLGVLTAGKTDYDPIIRVQEPLLPAGPSSARTRAMHAALTTVYKNPSKAYTLSDIVNLCGELDSTLDLIDLRRRYLSAIRHSRQQKLKVIEQTDNPNYLLSVRIADMYRPALQGLCKRIDSLKDERDARKYQDRARHILSDSLTVRQLARYINEKQ